MDGKIEIEAHISGAQSGPEIKGVTIAASRATRQNSQSHTALLAVPQCALPGPLDLSHELEHAIQESLCCRRASRHIHCRQRKVTGAKTGRIAGQHPWSTRQTASASLALTVNRHDSVASSHDGVAVVVVASSICTRSHRDDVSWLWHLIVDLAQGWCHLVCERSGDNHNVRLAGGSSEHDTESVLIISGRGDVHHLYCTAGKSECHGPERSLTCPVDDLVHGGKHVL